MTDPNKDATRRIPQPSEDRRHIKIHGVTPARSIVQLAGRVSIETPKYRGASDHSTAQVTGQVSIETPKSHSINPVHHGV